MEVYAKNTAGVCVTMKVEPHTTIEELSQMLKTNRGIPYSQESVWVMIDLRRTSESVTRSTVRSTQPTHGLSTHGTPFQLASGQSIRRYAAVDHEQKK